MSSPAATARRLYTLQTAPAPAQTYNTIIHVLHRTRQKLKESQIAMAMSHISTGPGWNFLNRLGIYLQPELTSCLTVNVIFLNVQVTYIISMY